MTPEAFWQRVDRQGSDECWPWLASRDRCGYGKVRGRTASRVAFELTNGPTDLYVLHTCDNPPCCNPAHLYAGTAAQNTADMIRRGRAGRVAGRSFGLSNGRGKLSDEAVRVIRQEYAPGRTRDLARRFGVSRWTVWDIATGKRRASVA